jgi:nucleoside-diphosphate-sugar epimerase
MIALNNLVDVTVHCCEAESPVSGIFNIADAHAYTLAEVVGAIRESGARRAWLWAVPYPLLKWMLTVLRGPGDAQRLLGNFILDTSLAQSDLGWQPLWNIRDVMRNRPVGAAP